MPDYGKIERSDWVLWCLAGAMAVILFLVQKTPIVTGVFLILLAGCLVVPALHLPLVQNAASGRPRLLSRTIAVLLVVIGVALFGVEVWPSLKPLHRLTTTERSQFVERLKAQPGPHERVMLTCPIGKEDECLVVAQFVDLFREANWIVEDLGVTRITPSQPTGGLVLFQHVESLPADPPMGSGVWTELTPSAMTIKEAFTQIGMKAKDVSTPAIPKGMIGVYFGPDMY